MSDENLQPSADALQAVSCTSATDVGLRREENQDSLTAIEAEKFKFFIVADGMGGVKGGAIASALAISTVKSKLEGVADITPEIIVSSVHDANGAIFGQGNEDPTYHGMGTTFVGLVFVDTRLYIVNVGDSRAYRFRGELARQLTDDHTLVRELVRSGAITEAQAKNHPVSHMLTRSLGPTPEVEVDCVEMTDGPATGDRYLLCSDGLYNLVHPREMFEAIRDNPPADAVTRLVALANERGGTDNITVIIVTVADSYPKSVADYPVVESLSDLYVGANPPPEPEVSQELPVAEVDGDGEETSEQDEEGLNDGEATPSMDEGAPSLPSEHHRSFSLRSMLFVVFAVGIGIGIFSGDIFRPAIPSDASQTANPNPLSAEVAPLHTIVVPSSRYPAHRLDVVEHALLGDELHKSPNDASSGDLDVSSSEAEVIQHRKELLKSRVAMLSERIDAFDRPFTGSIGTDAPSQAQVLKIKSDATALDVEIATETRKLAVWVGRKKRLEAMDPVDLASEVAVSSEDVRRSKDLFEKASWEFLKEVEVYRYNPNDAALKEKIAGLAMIRNQRIDELRQQVRAAIDSEIGKSNQKVAELSSRRDALQDMARGVEQDADFFKVLMGADEGAKNRRKQDLSREREIAIAELSELTRIVPDSSR